MRIKDAIRANLQIKAHTGVVLLEFPPVCRHVILGRKKFYLSFPYHYFLIGYKNPGWWIFRMYGLEYIRVMMRKTPLTTIEDKMAPLPLPNCSGMGNICLGDFRNIPHFTLSGMCWSAIDFFWRSQFAEASTTNWGMSHGQWEKWSQRDPAFIFNQGWVETTPLTQVVPGIRKLRRK